MPNWCINTLDVSGARDDLDAFAAEARGIVGGKELALSLHALVPEPEWLDDSAWYDWCCENWGTKWDLDEVDLYDQVTFLSYAFATAWSPPLPGLHQVARRFPRLLFVLRYVEPGIGFAGEGMFKGGVECGEYYTTDADQYNEFLRDNFPDLWNDFEDYDDDDHHHVD
jgi:hypothetical protein